ncbi:MAG TPA: DUF1844 domain-containing protein [Candidatus Hydrogenedentes bacterium]|nr:DUF1844 domain-containing protein [Candidatus Hydrogenedentota bacterium]
MAEDQPKIIVDEDWKEKVKREKEEAAKKAQETPAADALEPDSPAAAPDAEAQNEGKQPTPFQGLVQFLAAQGLMTLGVIAPRETKEVYIDLDGAEYYISVLVMLKEKTQGNLTPEETGSLREVTAELQRLYALRVQEYHEHMMKQAAQDPSSPQNPG